MDKKSQRFSGKKNENNKSRQSNFEMRPKKNGEAPKVNGGVFIYSKPLSVSELSEAINTPINAIIKYLFAQGKMVTINQVLDDDMIGELCLEFGYDFKKEKVVDATHFEELEIEDDPSKLEERSPVVTVMGHVDHGKTSIIDAIRHTNVAGKEAGGISQAIGAYQKEWKGKKVTIIDTPGHAAFTAMRARGASVTDIVVLVVAADDGVMPQTIEAIDHAKAAGSEIIVAINKMDLPGANPNRVKNELMAQEIVAEDFGGDILTVEVSAKTKQGLDDLLDAILLKAEMMELKANPNRYAIGTVLEANLDKGEGPKATLLIQNGTLNQGDHVVVGTTYGKIRRMNNELGVALKSAGPSSPVSVIGLEEVPEAGDRFMAFPSEKEAREVATARALKKKEEERAGTAALTLADLNNIVNSGKIQDFNILIKADTQGSAESLKANLEKLSNDQVRIKVLEARAGAISDSDVLLASASKAIIYGFNLRPDARVQEKAKEEHVEIRTYRIIYEILEEVEAVVKGMYQAEMVEHILGSAEVRHRYKLTDVGVVAGSYVVDGLLRVNAHARLIRDQVVVYEGKINSLARFKDRVKEVNKGYECGVTLSNYQDIKEGDIIECFEVIEKEEKNG